MFALLLAPIGYFAAPYLLDLVNAAPEVKAQALPFLRINFIVQHRHAAVLHAELARCGPPATRARRSGSASTMTLLNLVLQPAS